MSVSRINIPILDTLIPFAFFDVVAVYDQNFKQIFRGARPVKVTVKEEAKLMEHPVETGATITDHRIILPIEIEFSMLLQAQDYIDVYREIRQYYLNATLLKVQTKSSVYENQLIASMPHEEDPSQFNTLVLALKFKQVQFTTPQNGIAPRHSKDSNKVERGTQESKAVDQSGAAEITDKVKHWWSRK